MEEIDRAHNYLKHLLLTFNVGTWTLIMRNKGRVQTTNMKNRNKD